MFRYKYNNTFVKTDNSTQYMCYTILYGHDNNDYKKREYKFSNAAKTTKQQ